MQSNLEDVIIFGALLIVIALLSLAIMATREPRHGERTSLFSAGERIGDVRFTPQKRTLQRRN